MEVNGDKKRNINTICTESWDYSLTDSSDEGIILREYRSRQFAWSNLESLRARKKAGLKNLDVGGKLGFEHLPNKEKRAWKNLFDKYVDNWR